MLKHLRLYVGLTAFLVGVLAFTSYQQSSSFRGQMIGGTGIPILYTPKGEVEMPAGDRLWGGSRPTFDVTWSNTNAVTYVLFFREKETGDLVKKITVSSSSLQNRFSPLYKMGFESFRPYKDYTITVQAVTNGGALPESNPNIFWVSLSGMPAYGEQKVDGLQPTGEIPSSDALLSWSALDLRTKSYDVDVEEILEAEEGHYNYSVQVSALRNKNAPEFDLATVMTLRNHGVYTFKVRGTDLKGVQSQWSDPVTFIINDDGFAESQPSLISPIDATEDFKGIFTWTHVVGTKYYHAVVRRMDTGESYAQDVYTRELADKNNPSMTVPAESAPQFLVGNGYVWEVQAFSQNDTPSIKSELGPFTITSSSIQDQTPIVLGPRDTVATDNIYYSWEKVPFATVYEITVTAVGEKFSKLLRVADIGEADIYRLMIPEFKLREGITYTFTLSALDRTNIRSKTSEPMQFIVANNFTWLVPIITSPKGLTSSFTGEVRWGEVSGASRYRIIVTSISGAPKQYNREFSVEASALRDPTQPAWIIDIPRDIGTTYGLWVQATNPAGYESRMSERVTFTIDGPVFGTLTAEGIGPSGTTPFPEDTPTIVRWKPVPEATSYVLTFTAGDGTRLQTEVAVASLEDALNPSYALDPATAQPSARVTFSLHAQNREGASTRESAPLTFTYDTTLYSRIIPSGLTPTPSNLTSDVTFHWNPIPHRTTVYELELKEGQNASVVYTVPVDGLTNALLPTLAKELAWGSNNTFRVRGLRTSPRDQTQWSPWQNLSIESIAPPIILAPINNAIVNSSAVRFNWKPVLLATSYVLSLTEQTRPPVTKNYTVPVTSNAESIFSPSLELSLPQNSSFTYTVQAFLKHDAKSPLSVRHSFRTMADWLSTAVPVIIGPLSGSAETSAVRWQKVPSATHYTLWVMDYTTGQNNTILNRRIAVSELADASNPSFAMPGLFRREGVYMAWIRASKEVPNTNPSMPANTVWSPWSKAFVFTPVGTHGKVVSAKPMITEPRENAVVRTPLVKWQPMKDAGSFRVFVRDLTTGTVTEVKVVPGSSSSYTLTKPLARTHRYAVWVGAIGGGEFSSPPWSDVRTFTAE